MRSARRPPPCRHARERRHVHGATGALATVFGKEVEDKKLPGAVMMVARKGKVVYVNALGARDPKTGDPMRADTIFRIYSMTKPIVSVAAMILVEDGKLQLTDPVAKWLPAFKDVKVWTDGGEVAAQRPMTVQDLLRHTAGLPYGELTQNAAVKDALAKAGLFKPGVIEFDVRDMTRRRAGRAAGKDSPAVSTRHDVGIQSRLRRARPRRGSRFRQAAR